MKRIILLVVIGLINFYALHQLHKAYDERLTNVVHASIFLSLQSFYAGCTLGESEFDCQKLTERYSQEGPLSAD